MTGGANGGPRVCLFEAAPDTGNLGLSALLNATLAGLAKRLPAAAITVFDNDWGVRDAQLELLDRTLKYRLCGARYSRRYWRPENLWTMRVCGWLGGLGNPGVRAIASARAALDVSGGDSFTDLYGMKRFWGVALPKLIALERGTPLVLLPQTYGPFANARTRAVAERIVRSAALAWARDARSFVTLRELLGDRFDPRRHRSGVDLAFGLERRPPRQPLPPALEAWLAAGDRPVIGLNVSGLLHNDPAGAAQQYGLRADYRAVIRGFLARVFEQTDARVVLVPHVLVPSGDVESDADACADVARSLPASRADRLVALPAAYNERETKGIIARLSWFCGTRMHATIAALSSGVPAAAIAYSIKTLGVFESCAQGEHVADPRALDTEAVIDQLFRSWQNRESAKRSLAVALPAVARQVDAQMDAIAAFIDRGAATAR
jgi:polysaccharide pyruvyl transferase WcaK-like protein